MSPQPRRFAAAAFALTLAGALAACGTSTASSTPGSTTAKAVASGQAVSAAGYQLPAAGHPEWSKYTFTIADNGGDGSEELSAITGVFKDAPYTVKFARFPFGPPLIQALISGAADIGSVGDVPPITGAAESFGFKIVGVSKTLTPETPAEDIIVPKDSNIQSLADLKGRSIAVPQGSSAHGLTLLALGSVGLKPSDVQIQFLDPSAGATAFNSGKVDAWAIWEPQVSLAVKAGARILAKGLPPIDQTSSYYVASDKSLADPDRRAALQDVFIRIGLLYRYANTHPDDFAKAIAKETGIPLDDAKSLVGALGRRSVPIGQEDIDAEQQLADAFLEAGQIKNKVDLKKITDNLLPEGFDSETLDVSGYPK